MVHSEGCVMADTSHTLHRHPIAGPCALRSCLITYNRSECLITYQTDQRLPVTIRVHVDIECSHVASSIGRKIARLTAVIVRELEIDPGGEMRMVGGRRRGLHQVQIDHSPTKVRNELIFTSL